jgi:hypothetical protein
VTGRGAFTRSAHSPRYETWFAGAPSSAILTQETHTRRERSPETPSRVAPQGFEEQGASDAAKGGHIDGAAEDLGEVLAKTHGGAEEVGSADWKVHEHIDVAALGAPPLRSAAASGEPVLSLELVSP